MTFRNNVNDPDQTKGLSMHPHGVFYDSSSEGVAPGIAFGNTHEYNWFVPERAGPGPADPSTKLWLYHRCVSVGCCWLCVLA